MVRIYVLHAWDKSSILFTSILKYIIIFFMFFLNNLIFNSNKNLLNFTTKIQNNLMMSNNFNQKNQLRTTLQQVSSILANHATFYPTSTTLNYFWSFGFLAFIFLAIQLISGIINVMHYTPDALQSFASVIHLMNTVPLGWLFKYIHANGASFFLLIIYFHIGRGLYFGSFFMPRGWIWITGVVIFLCLMGTAFIGYVLPWGQMSFWGATVITNLLSAFPYGDTIAMWIWGGFAVSHVTLNRFFSLHYLLPFIILGLVISHIYVLHDVGSNNPRGIDPTFDLTKVSFAIYYTSKDIFATFVILILFIYIVFFNPDLLGHSDNYIPANPMVTPAHIVPEWYFLPFYAILRSIPHKLLGVLAMLGAILIPMLFATYFFSQLLLNDVKLKRSVFLFKFVLILYWFFVFNFIFLGFIGGSPVEYPYYMLGVLSTTLFFLYWVVMPLLIWFYIMINCYIYGTK